MYLPTAIFASTALAVLAFTAGALTLRGTVLALVFCIVISCSCGESVLAAAVGFVGCMFDSVLGSRAQVRYLCTRCGMVTERNEHCGAACIKEKGIAWMNNDVVNLLSNVFALVLALAVYAVMP